MSLTRGRAAPDTPRSVSASGARPTRTRSRDKRNTVDFLERGLAAFHGIERGVAQEARAAGARRLLELAHRGAPGDQLADLVVENHELCDGLAPLVARAAALPAAASQTESERARLRYAEAGLLEELGLGPVVLDAVRADQAHQALREYRVQRGNEAEKVHAHVHEAPDHVEDVIGVDRGEHQVSGERRLHGDVGGFRIAYLAHHDLVRIVAQDGAQAAREGQPLFLVYRNLQDSRELVLHRILDGDDLVLAVVDLGDGGIEGGGLAAPRGPRDEQHPVGLVREPPQDPDVFLLESEAVQGELLLRALVERLFVQDAQHRVLAVDVRHDRDAEVDRPPAVEGLEAPVLRDAPLGDVELGEDLHAGNGLLGLLRVLDELDLRQDAVDAELDHEPGGDGLHVDVARADHQRVAQGRAHQADHFARFVADRPERQVLYAARLLARVGDVGAHRVQGAQGFLVARQKRHQIAPVGEAPGERLPDALLRPGLLVGRKGVVGDQQERAALVSQERAAALRAFAEGEHVEGGRRAAQLLHVHHRYSEG